MAATASAEIVVPDSEKSGKLTFGFIIN
jgi:hypothetical protein